MKSRKKAVNFIDENDMEEITAFSFAVCFFMNILVFGIAAGNSGISPGWYVAGIISFVIALVVWIVNPFYQQVVGFVLVSAAVIIPIFGTYQTWSGKQ